jgi:translation initiation factor IF-2
MQEFWRLMIKYASDDKPRGGGNSSQASDGTNSDDPRLTNRPPRPAGDRPFTPRSGGGDRPAGDRPPRPAGDRPFTPRSGGGDRPYTPRPAGDRPAGDRPYTPRPAGDRPAGDRPYTPRPAGDRPAGDRPYTPRSGGGDRPMGDRPPRPAGDRPFNSDRPAGGPPRSGGMGGGPRGGGGGFGGPGGGPGGAPGGGVGGAVPGGRGGNSGRQRNTTDRKSALRSSDAVESDGQGRGKGGKGGKGSSILSRLPQNRQQAPRPVVRPKGPVQLGSNLTVRELSEATGVSAAEILKSLLKGGVMANINQQIDYETAALICTEFNIETVEYVPEQLAGIVENIKDVLASESTDSLITRPPVVTIMGHVDHGKTKLLDAIRQTRVAEGEAGGITQHVGAYQVEVGSRKITFLDTPGHEAFTAMRARGAQVTDIVVLVVAANDGVMPQTIEAISHVKAAGVPMIIAINKIDTVGANPDLVKQQLATNDVIVESYGGDVPSVEVSALMKLNIDGLLEMILLVADIQDYKANPDNKAVGTVVEAEMDRQRGPIATVLIQNGTLRLDDNVLVGNGTGTVRAMFNDTGKRIRFAEPSTPVLILGLNEVPKAGDILQVMDDLTVARDVAVQRQRQIRIDAMANLRSVSLDGLFANIQQGKIKELNLIVKVDVQGSIGAIEHALGQLNTNEVQIKIIHRGTGTITESDVNLAVASRAIIIGFNARPDPAGRRAAEQHGIDIRFYNIIYNLVEEMKKAMIGMLDPEYREVTEGYAEVRNTFRLPSREIVAGLYVTDGKINRQQSVRVLRSGVVLHEGRLSSLRRFKEDVREVNSGYECGVVVESFTDVQTGDNLEFFRKERVERTA